MTADADGLPSDQPRLPRSLAAYVAEAFSAVRHNDVRDELLVRRVRLRLRPGHERGDAAHEELAEIALRLEHQALKHPDLLDDASLDDQNFLFLSHGNSSCRDSSLPVLPRPIPPVRSGPLLDSRGTDAADRFLKVRELPRSEKRTRHWVAWANSFARALKHDRRTNHGLPMPRHVAIR